MVAANRLADVTKAFSELSPEMKTNIVNWGLVAAAAGPMILIFSKITSGAAETLKSLRNLAIFLSANAAVFSGAAAALAVLASADWSAKGIETLSERRGLGLNESGRSKEVADLRAEQDALARARAMEAYDKAAVSRQSGKGGYSPTRRVQGRRRCSRGREIQGQIRRRDAGPEHPGPDRIPQRGRGGIFARAR
jgi:hypothetical protein